MQVDINSLSALNPFKRSDLHTRLILPPRYGEGASVEIARIDRVVFLPDVLETGQSICLALKDSIPTGAILDEWTLNFVQKHIACNPQVNYRNDFEVDSSPLDVCILSNVFSRNFGHWTEEMIKVCILEHIGFDGQYVISSLPQFAIEFLQFIGIEDDRVVDIRRPTIFKSAVFLTPVDHSNIDKYPNILFLLRDSILSRIDSDRDGCGENIWLDRVNLVQHGGVLVNREEVFNCIARYGFTIVDMASLPINDQLNVAQHMRIVCGVHGSQFVHVQFMPAASAVVECFSPSHVNPSVIEVCRALGHKYNQIVAVHTRVLPYPHGRDTVINCNHLDLVIRNLVKGK